MSLRIALTHVFGWPEVRRGGERYLHELAAALVDGGHHVTALTTSCAPGRGQVLGVEVRYLRRHSLLKRRFGALSGEAAFGLQALTYLAGRRLDVWHALGASDAAASALLGTVRPVRSVYTNLGLPIREWWDSRPDRRLHEMVVKRSDHYLCLSDEAGSFLRRDFGREPLVLGGGVDVRRFRPAESRSTTPTLLFAGAVDERRKNLSLLIRAVGLLCQDQHGLELWISGPGSRERLFEDVDPRLREAVVDKGLGQPEDLQELYGRAWATVLPSHNEAFGLALVESLACGTPVVALEGGGPGEIVRDGIGFKCQPNERSLADACAAALDLASRPGTVASCRSAAASYDWRSSVVPRMEAIYSDRTNDVRRAV